MAGVLRTDSIIFCLAGPWN